MPTVTLDPDGVIIGEQPLYATTLQLPDGSGLWQAWACTRTARVIEIPLHVLQGLDLTEGKGQIPSCSFDVDKYAQEPGGAYWANRFPLIEAEIQVAYDGIVMFWGPIVALTAGSDGPIISFSSVGCWWYMGKRLAGNRIPVSRNWLRNPEFVDDLGGWQTAGDATLDTVVFETGTQSVKLVGADARVSQRVNVDIHPTCNAIIEMRVKVGAGVTSGLGVAVTAPGGTGGSDAVSFRTHPWTAADALDEWVTVLVAFTYTPKNPASPQTLVVTVWGSDDDDVHVDSGSLRVIGVDLGDGGILSRKPRPGAVLDLQAALAALVTQSAADLNMGVIGQPTGATIVDEWSTHPDRFASEVARLFTDRENGIDIDVELTPTTRTVRGSYPRKGRDFAAADLTLRHTAGEGSPAVGNLSRYGLGRDGDKLRTEMNMIDESGIWGTARDGSALGGLLLQDLQQAPTGTSLEDLGARSRAELRANPGAVETLTCVVAWAGGGGLSWGDTVMVVIDDGAVQIDARYLVVTRSIKAGAGVAVLTLNPWSAP